jgi:DNA-binding HxlR family transcriptional regulator
MGLACCSGNCSNNDNEYVLLTERESRVCQAICDSGQPQSFSQLKNSTSLHQEILSRILKRLTIHGLVVRTDRGYKGKCGQ